MLRVCEACGARFEFVKGPNGKQIPVQKVRVVYALSAGETELTKFLPKKDQLNVPKFYVSHYETCSDPERFSRRRR